MRPFLLRARPFLWLYALATMAWVASAWWERGISYDDNGIGSLSFVLVYTIGQPFLWAGDLLRLALPALDDAPEAVGWMVGLVGGGVVYVGLDLLSRRWAQRPSRIQVDGIRLREPTLDDPLARALCRELQLLAARAELQLAFLPAFVVKADELALRFDDVWPAARWQLRFSDAQRSALERIASALSAMSEDPGKSVWTDEAVVQDVRWEHVRELARNALAALGWPATDPPTDDNGTYIQ